MINHFQTDIDKSPKTTDRRTDLLDQIRAGKSLKKVEERKLQPKKQESNLNSFEDVMKHVMSLRFDAMNDTSSDTSSISRFDTDFD